MTHGTLLVLSGPSGVGKSTAVAALQKLRPQLRFSISATTRPPRPSERDGVNYYFVDRPAFETMIDQGELLEHAEYVGNYYGTPAGPIDKLLEAGYDVLLDIEVQGAMQVRQRRSDAVLVFLAGAVLCRAGAAAAGPRRYGAGAHPETAGDGAPGISIWQTGMTTLSSPIWWKRRQRSSMRF